VGTMIASRTEEAVPGELAVVFCAPSGILGNWSRPAYDSTWKGLGGRESGYCVPRSASVSRNRLACVDGNHLTRHSGNIDSCRDESNCSLPSCYETGQRR
jgi:hypothetical protein